MNRLRFFLILSLFVFSSLHARYIWWEAENPESSVNARSTPCRNCSTRMNSGKACWAEIRKWR